MICTIINDKAKCVMNDNIPTLVVLIGITFIYLLITSALQYYWNNSISHIFNLPTITFFEAFGLLIVSFILFKF